MLKAKGEVCKILSRRHLIDPVPCNGSQTGEETPRALLCCSRGRIWRHLWLSQSESGVIGTLWVEARNAAKTS